MAGVPSVTTTFPVRRGERKLVSPSRPTPYEFKMLSDIDDQDVLRFYRSGAFFYRSSASKAGLDPAKVIRSALSEALVHFYPLAGRFRELRPTRKLVVECTGEGVVFVEADADVRMDDLGDSLAPPVPCYDKLLCEPESPTADVIDRPLLYVQVTRLRCGGFVFGSQICHCIADGTGIVQFLTTLTELARGVPGAPTLCRRPFRYALQLLAEAKARASREGYVQSVAGFNAARRRPPFPKARSYLISDVTNAGLLAVDFGWGRPVYGGPATIMLASFHQEGRNEAGEPGILVPIRLPASAMERLKQNVRKELAGAHVDDVETAADETNSNMHGGGVLAKL
ncbi:benzyl alcohol O-benzoyltransferase [Zea mays]|uniref:benzyl alcohol O-benzoyltransferase n=1 Tax=Zea mays TaxID=4577 RepID=UPI0009A988CB|nr:benzyl alcohol O-benzoyltransferase [Zea mays]|eukprot:XP_020399910.1 benzyl alcohol O-benzoyltransferase [Zea mays]